MTFKHVKFGDSVTMRSLEKVAQEKGWIKNDPITKTASGPDLNPSVNFMENVVKLCSGLRHSGFDKYADELENAFVAYKQADKSYDVSNEKGEDLIEAAHPEGGHQMEGVEGDAYVEDILEKHLKMLEVSNKEPTAKKSSKDILKAVKTVLAQAPSAHSLINDANKDINIVFSMATRSGGLTAPVLSWLEGRKNIIGKLVTQSEEDLSVADINEAMSTIDSISRNLHPNAMHNYLPEFLNKGISTDVLWSKVSEKLQSAKAKLQEAAGTLAEHQANPDSRPTEPAAVNPVLVKIQGAQNALNGIASLVKSDTSADPGDVKAVNDWMSRVGGALKSLESSYTSMSPEDAEASLAKITKDFAEVKKQWM
jgi:hypothetical protein